MTGGGLDSALANVPHFVYRFYDEDGALLYVGATSSIGNRLTQHGSKDWWPDVRGIEAEHFPTMREALDAERAVIEATQPKHNTVFTERYTNGWPRIRAEDAAAHAAGRLCNRKWCRVGCNEKAHANGVQCAHVVNTYVLMDEDFARHTYESASRCMRCVDDMPSEFFGDEAETASWRELVERVGRGRVATYMCESTDYGKASEALEAVNAGVTFEGIEQARTPEWLDSMRGYGRHSSPAPA